MFIREKEREGGGIRRGRRERDVYMLFACMCESECAYVCVYLSDVLCVYTRLVYTYMYAHPYRPSVCACAHACVCVCAYVHVCLSITVTLYAFMNKSLLEYVKPEI